MGRGEKSLPCDSESELRRIGGRDKRRAKTIEGTENTHTHTHRVTIVQGDDLDGVEGGNAERQVYENISPIFFGVCALLPLLVWRKSAWKFVQGFCVFMRVVR